MAIKTFKIIVVELQDTPEIKMVLPTKENRWECEPEYEGGKNPRDKFILNILYKVNCFRGNQQAIMNVMTSFELELTSNDFAPKTKEDMEFYVTVSQMAAAHARAMFLYEFEDTVFKGALLPQDGNASIAKKIELAFGLSGREN